MAKQDIDKNFENLKAQMMKKKDMAKKNNEDINITTSREILEPLENNNKDNSGDTQEYKEEIKNTKHSNGKIVIKKQEKADVPKRITYYLNNSTIKKIDKYSKMAGMGKSAFVQTLLDLALDNLEIE